MYKRQALRQHDEYIKTLEKTGVTVDVLEAVEEYPDSCFVEDVAVLTPKGAVITLSLIHIWSML